MSDQKIHLNFSIKEIFELVPSLAAEVLKYSPLATEISDIYKGTSFTFAIQIDDEIYNVVINDGRNFQTGCGDLKNAMIRFKTGMKDLEELIVVKNAYMFLGTSLSLGENERGRMSSMAEKLNAINGTIHIELTNDNQSISKFSVSINKAEATQVTIKLSIGDFREMLSGSINPINLFMSGRLKLEGDIGLGLALQGLLF